MGDVGKPRRTITIEPLPETEPVPEPTPEPAAPEPEKVPA